jgi:putative ABC transport system permease protein
MKLFELIEESFGVLKTNKMRTGLSILGIVIGISSVIILVTLGKATQQSTIDRISALGSNLLTIRPGSVTSGFIQGQRGEATTLTYEDALAISTDPRITSIDKIAAEYSSNGQVAYERNNTNVAVNGITPDYFEVRNINILSGSAITQSDMELLNKVAVLGPSTAEDLFGAGTNPLGLNIKIEGISFRVIGVTEEKGSAGRTNLDEAVYIPLTTAQKAVFGVDYVSNIYVTALDTEDTEMAESQIGYFLLERHKIKSPIDADFSISSSTDLLETVSEVTGTFTTLLAGIAAISLVVGGIGIMNIMLVTVTERTQEIGIRKALGAKKKTIIAQFLIESVVLTITGGVFGALTGVFGSLLITSKMDLPQVIATESIFLAVGVSCLIGIVFGWYPAQRASKLQPIEALRYE